MFLGAFISFALFALMASLVATEDVYLEDVPEFQIVEIIDKAEDSNVERTNRALPPPPEPMSKPSGIYNVAKGVDAKAKLPSQVKMPDVNLGSSLSNQEFSIGIIKDTTAHPIYRSLPRYPLEAARKKIPGWVKLSFSINRQGEVEDISIIDSEPKIIFDQAAITALQRWKYKPQLESGKTVKQTGLTVRIDFGKN